MKVMALDYGEKRVGLASTDDAGTFALPRTVLSNDATLLDQVLAFKLKEGVSKVVIGESKNLDGTPNPINAEVEKFKRALEERGVEVVLHPEVFTTQEAIRIQGENNLTDASAAALILKNYLDSLSAG
ncbi:Holliday junction resolvase RuvX [Candidatus Parcubacteria bacterium]|nr:Holliday junction resolvase RuvX [Candidatus Parcubacteria bacterium]